MNCYSDQRDNNGIPEWAIIELQGLIQVKKENAFYRIIGDLHYYNKNKHPVLVLGHHVLNGKEIKLDQPMAVLEKVMSDNRTSYKVCAIVKKKLLFKSRPKPIISNMDKS
ncbi:Chromosome transmission fidelity protein 8 homolog [Eumeta japonica]|uniref:Chromosome transmission fidelity protein 8 homolog n=1 Tax=Eumeta variegata TaxID=151549 RepID=A0A4C1V9P7_EUMVA|nr:Chromosome transmission fidelity protein 8 homolog [Eumeta japonica]